MCVDGPYPCGLFNDLVCARQNITSILKSSEMLIADQGYRDGHEKFMTPLGDEATDAWMARVRSRHETVNARLKSFGILSGVFRHHITKHRLCFFACVNLTQMAIKNGNALFEL